MTPREIRALMLLKGIRDKDIARMTSLGKTTVNAVIRRDYAHPKSDAAMRIRRALAWALGVDYHLMWDQPGDEEPDPELVKAKREARNASARRLYHGQRLRAKVRVDAGRPRGQRK